MRTRTGVARRGKRGPGPWGRHARAPRAATPGARPNRRGTPGPRDSPCCVRPADF